MEVTIKKALVSVYHKNNLDTIFTLLHENNVELYSTGGTEAHIRSLGIPVETVEDLTSYPAILGGRVKTLHPKVFGGILNRTGEQQDQDELAQYKIPNFDLVIVDLYPFEDTVQSGASNQEIIEKIDIGGISLIRAAAKNYNDVLVVAAQQQYGDLQALLEKKGAQSTLEERQWFASHAFAISSHYDTQIFQYFNQTANLPLFRESQNTSRELRYGENPHQQARYYGDLSAMLEQLNGKELSYNNLVDVESAVRLISEFKGNDPAFAIIKHTNACGMATGKSVKEAYEKAFAADTLSAFGGILACNTTVNHEAAKAMHSLFFEVLIAPDFEEEAFNLLKGKKNRILLKMKAPMTARKTFKTLLNGVIEQDSDAKTDSESDLKVATSRKATGEEIAAMLFGSKVCKHTKSNTIVLAKNGQLLASGVGQTSRVDALKQAIDKAGRFGFDLNGAVMVSDAFFPFQDSVEVAQAAGITAVLQPGGSKRDQESIDFCDKHGMAMVFTGIRHFLH